MMNKQLPLDQIVESVSSERRVTKEVIVEALEAALASATKKKYASSHNGMNIDVKVCLDPVTGEYENLSLLDHRR